MPIQPTYPGVYIEELPSGVHTITGVATSITAFVGSAPRGQVNSPTTVTSYAEFERTFGGLSLSSALGYAVQDFYLNGGSTAIIVRLFSPDTDNSGNPINAKTKLSVAGLTLEAASEGSWGNNLVVKIDHNVTYDSADGKTYDPNATEVFNLTAKEIVGSQTARIEVFPNLTVADGPRRIDKVLTAGSQLVNWDSTNPLPSAAAVTAAAAAMQPIIPLQNALLLAQRAKPVDPKAVQAAQQALDQAMATLNQQTITTKATDGQALGALDFTPQPDGRANKQGIYALEKADLFNILCIPPYLSMTDVDTSLLADCASYCAERRAMLLVDAPSDWLSTSAAVMGVQDITLTIGSEFGKNAAIFFPRLLKANILHGNQVETFVSSGAVAGIFARTDAERGVWKAPAGTEASIAGIAGLSVPLTDGENGELNPLGINCIRIFPATGGVVWGARTLQGDDRLASEWKYVPVRRTALFIEESLYRGLQWVVFEPNDEPLWAQIRLNVGAFMHNLFRQGAFQGQTPKDAYLVKCDSETTTQNDIDLGIVNILVGFAPLKPAEFVIIQIQQLAGQIQV
jgi:phage tail sheath protein FI